MGRQLIFCCGEELRWNLIEHARTESQILAYNFDNKCVVEVPEQESFKDFRGSCFIHFYMAKSGELLLSPHGHIDSLRSPVIEFSYTGISHSMKRIGISRVWYERKFYSDSGQVVSKDESLDKWYNRMTHFLKKQLKWLNPPYYFYDGRLAGSKVYIDEEVERLLSEGYRISQI